MNPHESSMNLQKELDDGYSLNLHLPHRNALTHRMHMMSTLSRPARRATQSTAHCANQPEVIEMTNSPIKFYKVSLYIDGLLSTIQVCARDCEDAQDVAVDELEANGKVHGEIVSIKRVI
jgi:hypothetical protein